MTRNYTWQLGDQARFGRKWNSGLNECNSSGQIPLDEVAAGNLSRWGSLSPGDGGSVQMGRDYWETQNCFESRLPGQPPKERIHATPGYGMSWAIGLTVWVGG